MNTLQHTHRHRMPLLLVLMLLLPMGAGAQSGWNQSDACPGWNNPSSFLDGSEDCYYKGENGKANAEAPNVKTGNVGMTLASKGKETGLLSGSGMSSAKSGMGDGYCDYAPAPEDIKNDKAVFSIYNTSMKVKGKTANKDPNTLDSLYYVPTQFNYTDTTNPEYSTTLTRSIRIGNAYGDGEGTALYYYMRVTPDNAMMILYYAAVFENAYHGLNRDPAIIIRVTQKNSNNTWEQISDTLAYYVSSTSKNSGGTVEDGVDGWHKNTPEVVKKHLNTYVGSCDVWYKDWSKVVINLSGLLYETVRIEVMAGDCDAACHYGYAFIAGECRPMNLTASGCPPGISTDVTTLSAPRGLLNYVWYASDYGKGNVVNENSCEPGGEFDYYTFRQLTDSIGTEADTAYTYHVKASDFHITKEGNSAATTKTVDSVGNRQIFRCTMTSAIDPTKPFTSNLYTTVQNTKPTMRIDTLSLCGGDVKLSNTSYVPGDMSGADLPATTWSFYMNPECSGSSYETLSGENVTAHFDDGKLYGVRVRTNTTYGGEVECYSEAIYPIRPLPNPVAQMTLSKKVLCDDEEVTLKDISEGSTSRTWRFRAEDANSPMQPTEEKEQTGTDLTITRSFTHAVEPVELTVRNGLYYVDPASGNTVYCADTAYDTVAVFLHPDLEVLGDTIVCQGSKTDASVRAIGVDDCTYEWSLTLGTITGGLPAGNKLQVTPYAEKSTYYVKVTSPQGCVAWDSIHCYLVVPKLQMLPADGKICPGETVRLIGTDAHSYSWTASPSDASLAGQEDEQEIQVKPQQTTTYTMTGHGANGCDASPLTKVVTVYPYPVSAVTVDPEIIDSDNPTVNLRDDSEYGVSSSWKFFGNEVVEGKEVTHTFTEATGADSVYVTLTTANELGCTTEYPFSIPVSLFTSWFPNIFTPGSEDANATFHLYTINAYEYFHIYIYNRFGLLVFESDDPHFEWDGSFDGKPLPQGTYTYICRFRKPGTYNIGQQHGSVTIVR